MHRSRTETVQVWLIRADVSPATVAALERFLDADERDRVTAMIRPEHRRRFIAAHGAARVIIGRHLGTAPESIRYRRGANGKPELTTGPLRTNLSHSGELVALALAPHRSVGVDVQDVSKVLDPDRMSARYFPPAEAEYVAAPGPDPERQDRFVRLWARKEACVKAAGGRIWQGVGLTVGAPVVRGATLAGPYRVRDLLLPKGFHGAVALEGSGGFRVTRRWWTP